MERLTVNEAADRLGISADAVRKRVWRGTLPHTKGVDGGIMEVRQNGQDYYL
jgi:excisionase family DNA binding protein